MWYIVDVVDLCIADSHTSFQDELHCDTDDQPTSADVAEVIALLLDDI